MKTKKILLPLAAVIVILAVVLVACGAKTSPTSSAGGSGNSAANGTPAFNGTPGARNLTQPLPVAENLLIGTLKLQGTSNALTASEAASLVPLWQAYAQLTSSNTAAPAEIDAVVTQIQQTLTPAQVQAITAMKLTRKDVFTEMSSLGLTNGGANGTPGFSFTPRAGGTGGGRGGAGGFGGGGGGGGAFFGGGGGGGVPGAGGTTTRPTPNATQLALRAQYANRIPTPLMNALIAYLQKIAGA